MQNKKKYQFHDTTLSSSVDFAYHALAVDEERKSFIPTLWKQSDKVTGGKTKQILEQRWFPGVHSNIGGGYPKAGLSDVALKWMIDKAADTGLAFEKKYLNEKINPNNADILYNSNKFPFSLLGKLVRKINELRGTNETIDESVFERMLLDFRPEPLYKPANVKASFQYSTNSSSG